MDYKTEFAKAQSQWKKKEGGVNNTSTTEGQTPTPPQRTQDGTATEGIPTIFVSPHQAVEAAPPRATPSIFLPPPPPQPQGRQQAGTGVVLSITNPNTGQTIPLGSPPQQQQQQQRGVVMSITNPNTGQTIPIQQQQQPNNNTGGAYHATTTTTTTYIEPGSIFKTTSPIFCPIWTCFLMVPSIFIVVGILLIFTGIVNPTQEEDFDDGGLALTTSPFYPTPAPTTPFPTNAKGVAVGGDTSTSQGGGSPIGTGIFLIVFATGFLFLFASTQVRHLSVDTNDGQISVSNFWGMTFTSFHAQSVQKDHGGCNTRLYRTQGCGTDPCANEVVVVEGINLCTKTAATFTPRDVDGFCKAIDMGIIARQQQQQHHVVAVGAQTQQMNR